MAVNTRIMHAKSVAKYMLLPGIVPRIQDLAGQGFGYLAFLFASVYRAVRILPATHPFVNPDNIGKFGLRDVIVAAANNVEMNRRNIDQIVVFFALLAAIVLMFLQFVLLIVAAFAGQAFAAEPVPAQPPFKSMFLTPYPQSDIAFLMLDYVFGIPAMGGETGSEAFFGSNALMATSGPTPFHQGLHALFHFYNLAILLVGVLIFLYFVVVVVIETAQTGVPFGQRFSKIYAPFRLVAAIGLLVPLNYGFNTAQYITLYVAKMGSSFATNGWTLYNRTLNQAAADFQNPMGVSNKSLVAKPCAPAVNELLYFSSIYHACRETYAIDVPKNNKSADAGICIKAYVIENGKARVFADNKKPVCKSSTGSGSEIASKYQYTDAKKLFGKNDMEIVLGELDTAEHSSYAGGVRPYCGKMTISLSYDNPPFYSKKETGGRRSESAETAANAQPDGILAIEALYFNNVRTMLETSGPFSAFGERIAHALTNQQPPVHNVCWQSSELGDGGSCANARGIPPAAAFQDKITMYRTQTEAQLNAFYDTFRGNLDLKVNEELEKRGWGGAGIWYNNIADINGSFTGAVYATPSVKRYPELMEFVKEEKQQQDKSTALCTMFEPNLSNGKAVNFQKDTDRVPASVMNSAYTYFACEKANQESGGESASTKAAPAETKEAPSCAMMKAGASSDGATPNVFVNVVSVIFGINGLFDIRSNSEIDPATGQPAIHPLAQLSTVGKSLVENSIRSMAVAVGASFGGGILSALGGPGSAGAAFGAGLNAMSGMFVSIATIGLTAGFLLYYILPFLPFIYFFFAVGSWVKSIFEAMVGVPLWALAHLHIDGDGFSGKAAAGGYFLLLEIFLRPIVTLFGLIGGIAVFGAMAAMLNNIFDLVVVNITGAPPGGSTSGITDIESLRRGVVDQFFFTIMYAILLYMMATASFKMIDTIPKHFMTWLSTGVTAFNDNKGDPTSSLTQYAAIGGSQVAGQVFGGVASGAGAVGQLGGGLANSLKTQPPTSGGGG